MECRARVLLPSHVREALQQLARQAGMTIHEYMRYILVNYVRTEESRGRIAVPPPVQTSASTSRRTRIKPPQSGMSRAWGAQL